MAAEYPSTSIRLALSVNSAPEVEIVDEQTDRRAAIYASADLSIEFAVFDEFENVVDLADITYVQASIFNDPDDAEPIATSSLFNLGSDPELTNVIPVLAWRNGTQEQATIPFSTSQLSGLLGPRAWLAINALTTSGSKMILAAGWIEVRKSGLPAYVLMPLSPVPAIIPAGALYEIPAGVTITFPTSPKILGQLICDPASDGNAAGNFVISSP